jgi:hypothetical protein
MKWTSEAGSIIDIKFENMIFEASLDTNKDGKKAASLMVDLPEAAKELIEKFITKK